MRLNSSFNEYETVSTFWKTCEFAVDFQSVSGAGEGRRALVGVGMLRGARDSLA